MVENRRGKKGDRYHALLGGHKSVLCRPVDELCDKYGLVIFSALGNGGAQSVDFGSTDRRN